jgi:hypothetical protein
LRERGCSARGALWRLEQRVQLAFTVAQLFELAELLAVERQLLELLRGLPEVLPQARVIVDELRIVEDQMLPDDAL